VVGKLTEVQKEEPWESTGKGKARKRGKKDMECDENLKT